MSKKDFKQLRGGVYYVIRTGKAKLRFAAVAVNGAYGGYSVFVSTDYIHISVAHHNRMLISLFPLAKAV